MLALLDGAERGHAARFYRLPQFGLVWKQGDGLHGIASHTAGPTVGRPA
jgi:hypothetical protein